MVHDERRVFTTRTQTLDETSQAMPARFERLIKA